MFLDLTTWGPIKEKKQHVMQSFAKFYAKFCRDKIHIINIMRNSAIHQRASARKSKLLFSQPLTGGVNWVNLPAGSKLGVLCG
jgi:hypothetical protein